MNLDWAWPCSVQAQWSHWEQCRNIHPTTERNSERFNLQLTKSLSALLEMSRKYRTKLVCKFLIERLVVLFESFCISSWNVHHLWLNIIDYCISAKSSWGMVLQVDLIEQHWGQNPLICLLYHNCLNVDDFKHTAMVFIQNVWLNLFYHQNIK